MGVASRAELCQAVVEAFADVALDICPDHAGYVTDVFAHAQGCDPRSEFRPKLYNTPYRSIWASTPIVCFKPVEPGDRVGMIDGLRYARIVERVPAGEEGETLGPVQPVYAEEVPFLEEEGNEEEVIVGHGFQEGDEIVTAWEVRVAWPGPDAPWTVRRVREMEANGVRFWEVSVHRKCDVEYEPDPLTSGLSDACKTLGLRWEQVTPERVKEAFQEKAHLLHSDKTSATEPPDLEKLEHARDLLLGRI